MLALLACGSLASIGSASAASLESIGTYIAPVYVTSDPGDANRIFVVEQGGGSNAPRIRLTTGGSTTTFLDASLLSSPGVAAGGEQGLLSMAFAPDFATSGRFYVFYTGTDAGTLHVDEFTASGNSVDVGSRRPVISIPHPSFNNHNGGQLQFGTDGNLYVSTGDGGSGGDPGENAQDTAVRLGKILRVTPTPGGGYTVPADNPFVGAAGADEVWSYGLRNPWRFSFDRLTGDLWVGDVGQAAWEEVNFDPVALGAGRGDNFGWDCYEGRHAFELTGCPAIGATTQPVHEYPNPSGGPAAVVGGYVVRDESVCELYGRYVYADTYAGVVRSLAPGLPDATDDRSEGLSVPVTTSFGQDAAGRVYVTSGNGPVYRIVHTEGASCPAPGGSQADTDPPFLGISARLRQDIGDRRFEVTADVDEQVTAIFEATIVRRRNGDEVGDHLSRVPFLEAGRSNDLQFKLSRGDSRRVKRLIRRGVKLKANVTGSATDVAGNTTTHELAIRLLLD